MGKSAAVLQFPTAAKAGFHNILIATDYSDIANRAVLHGLRLARRYRSTVWIANVVSSMGFAIAGPEAVTEAVELGLKDVEELREQLRTTGQLAGVKAHAVSEYGPNVGRELQELASKIKPDLIVVGTNGRTGLNKMVVGSVAERMLRNAGCPVLTVGPNAIGKSFSARPRYLFPTDFSEASLAALDLAIALSEEDAAELILMNVAGPKGDESEEESQQRESKVRERLRKLIPVNLCSRLHTLVEFGGVVDCIVEVADELCASMIVMGLAAEKSYLEKRWEHAYHVVSAAPCPVLTVRQNRD